MHQDPALPSSAPGLDFLVSKHPQLALAGMEEEGKEEEVLSDINLILNINLNTILNLN